AADARVGDLHAAAVADDAFVLRPLVLAAGAFPVPLGPEDALAEQTVLLGAVSTVVDGLGLLHLAERPRTNIVRACELNTNRAVVVNTIVDGFSHDRSSLSLVTRASRPWLIYLFTSLGCFPSLFPSPHADQH